MAAKQRMRLANEKHSKNITTRGNVPKSLVRYFLSVFDSDIQVDAFHMSLSLVCDYSAVTFTKSHMYHILSMIYIFQAMSCLVQHYELETGWIWKKIIWFILAWSVIYSLHSLWLFCLQMGKLIDISDYYFFIHLLWLTG